MIFAAAMKGLVPSEIIDQTILQLEKGTHHDLLLKQGLYYQLWKSQQT